MHKPTGLLLSVGMSVESEVFSITMLAPEWVAFVCTTKSRQSVDDIVRLTGIAPSRYQIFEHPDDPLLFGEFVEEVQKAYAWLLQKVGESGSIAVNPTAGKKWMSGGIILFTCRTTSRLVYVEVDYENRGPKPGTERLVELGSADDAIGLFASDPIVEHFNRFDFDAACRGFANLRPTRSGPRALYEALRNVAGALAAWDRFEHYDNPKIAKDLREAASRSGEVARELRLPRIEQWATAIGGLCHQINDVSNSKKPSLFAVADLLANAHRRSSAGKFEDAAARAYRALEAVAEWLLAKRSIEPGRVDWRRVTEKEGENYRKLCQASYLTQESKLGLEKAFLLAAACGIEEAKTFVKDGRLIFKKDLEQRNKSILAHGWTPQKDGVKKWIRQITDVLRKLDAGQLPEFEVPRLPRLWI